MSARLGVGQREQLSAVFVCTCGPEYGTSVAYGAGPLAVRWSGVHHSRMLVWLTLALRSGRVHEANLSGAFGEQRLALDLPLRA